MKCPACPSEKEMEQVVEKTKFHFKGQDVWIDYHTLRCPDCFEKFTTTEMDDINLSNIINSTNETIE